MERIGNRTDGKMDEWTNGQMRDGPEMFPVTVVARAAVRGQPASICRVSECPSVSRAHPSTRPWRRAQQGPFHCMIRAYSVRSTSLLGAVRVPLSRTMAMTTVTTDGRAMMVLFLGSRVSWSVVGNRKQEHAGRAYVIPRWKRSEAATYNPLTRSEG